MWARRRVRAFFDWRWAPFVALVAASLSFVLLIALLMPAQFDGGPYRVDASPRFAHPRAVEPPSAPEEARRFVAPARPPSEAPTLAPPSEPQALEPPSSVRVVPSVPDSVSTASLDYGANIADRGDRPHALAGRFFGH